MTLKEKVCEIQAAMKAPKNLYNSFGKYSYRNCEGIFEAFKPYGLEYKVVLNVRDSIELIGDRFYVMAEATLFDCESEESITSLGWARESDDKKGMDPAQITGATSSYARKYALNGLLLLDDTKDVDTEEYQTSKEKANKSSTKQTDDKDVDIPTESIQKIMEKRGIKEATILKLYNVKSMTELSQKAKANILKNIDKIVQKQEEKV